MKKWQVIFFLKNNTFKIIGLRFFTVFGPYGRPDMAYYSFTESLLKKRQIFLHNNPNMARDMTYIDDIIDGHHETETPLSDTLLHDILSTCSELTSELNSSQQENHMLNIRKKTQQIQQVARKMRSL